GARVGHAVVPASDRILMTLGAGLGVVDRPKPVGNLLALLEGRFVSVEIRLSEEPIGLVVEACRSFCGSLTVNGVIQVEWGADPYRDGQYDYAFQGLHVFSS